jgi:hypothetical protein
VSLELGVQWVNVTLTLRRKISFVPILSVRAHILMFRRMLSARACHKRTCDLGSSALSLRARVILDLRAWRMLQAQSDSLHRRAAVQPDQRGR